MCRIGAVYLGVFQHSYFQSHLFDLQPVLGAACGTCTVPKGKVWFANMLQDFLIYAVNELYGRTFATWTLTTCALCLICAKNPRVRAIYGAWSAPPTPLALLARQLWLPAG